MPLIALVVIALLGVTCPVSASQPDSLIAKAYTTVSVGNASVSSRVTEVGDTVGVPFNYQIGFGINGSYGKFVFSSDYQYERVNGLNYVNIEYTGRYTEQAYEVGARYREIEREAGLYILSVYAEGKILGWFGVGITRQHIEPWLGDAATMARFSLSKNTFDIWRLLMTIRAEYETKPGIHRQYFYIDIRNFRHGRFALVPVYRFELVARDDQANLVAYQGQIRLTINLD
jgi:hypothetical protein